MVLPSLWVITSVVFFLSKTASPRTVASFYEAIEEGKYRSAQAASQQQVFRQYLQRTGQNQPLFYWTIRPLAEPDTLSRVLLPRDRTLLRTLLHQYGNWPAILGYYQSLVGLEAAVNALPNPALRAALRQETAVLFTRTEPMYVRRTLQAIATLQPTLTPLATAVSEQFTRVARAAEPWRSWVPVLQWNGLRNQYHQWMSHLLRGDLGVSDRDARPVSAIIGEALGHTWLLVLVSVAVAFGLSIGLAGWLSHPAQERWRAPVLNFLYVLDTVPLFVLALGLLLLLTGSRLMALFPVDGLGEEDPEAGPVALFFSQLYHLTVPIVCLIVAILPYLTSQVYQALQGVMDQEYIQTARAKGLSEYAVIGRHALRNALLPLITLLTGFIPTLVGGALVVEVIFAIPGMGRLLADSVLANDYPVILGIVLCLALAKMLALVLADVLYYRADPRIRF